MLQLSFACRSWLPRVSRISHGIEVYRSLGVPLKEESGPRMQHEPQLRLYAACTCACYIVRGRENVIRENVSIIIFIAPSVAHHVYPLERKLLRSCFHRR